MLLFPMEWQKLPHQLFNKIDGRRQAESEDVPGLNLKFPEQSEPLEPQTASASSRPGRPRLTWG